MFSLFFSFQILLHLQSWWLHESNDTRWTRTETHPQRIWTSGKFKNWSVHFLYLNAMYIMASKFTSSDGYNHHGWLGIKTVDKFTSWFQSQIQTSDAGNYKYNHHLKHFKAKFFQTCIMVNMISGAVERWRGLWSHVPETVRRWSLPLAWGGWHCLGHGKGHPWPPGPQQTGPQTSCLNGDNLYLDTLAAWTSSSKVLSHTVLHFYSSVQCVCIFCIVMLEPLSIFFLFFYFDNIFHLDVHYVCMLVSALSHRVGVLQISMIIIIIII